MLGHHVVFLVVVPSSIEIPVEGFLGHIENGERNHPEVMSTG